MDVKTAVIVCDYGYVEGGASKVALDTVRLLHGSGVRVILFCGTEKVAPEVVDLGIRVVRLGQYDLKSNPSRVRAMVQGLWNAKAARTLEELLAELDPAETIVHLHYWIKICSPSILSVLRRSGFRTFYTSHIYYLGCGNGAYYDYKRQRTCTLRGGGARCLLCNCDRGSYPIKLWRFVRHWIIRYQLNRFPSLTILTISELNARIIRGAIGGRFRYRAIHNPIAFPNCYENDIRGKEAFYFIGRVSSEKGADLFARAVTESGVRGVVVGDGPELEELKARYPQLEYTGWLSTNEIVRRVRQDAACFVFTSVLYECEPLTPLEMMAQGIPCIISDVTAAVEYVKDGETGILFRSNDVEDLKRRIRILSDPRVRARMSDAIRHGFDREAWTEESYLGKLMTYYREASDPINAKIIVATHKPYWMPEDPVYLPVHVGAAGKNSIGFQRDDEGENISVRNPNWCELTGLYWAWKNQQCDVLGLAHYRRHFKGANGALTADECSRLLERTDVILPKPRNYYIETNYSQYVHAHHPKDLGVTRTIISERYPDYLPAWDKSMRSPKGHRFNMFIMKRELADRYCEWLFDILFELERRLDISSYSKYDARVFGFVSERMLDPWLATNGIAYVEVPVWNLESQNWPKKIFNFILRKIGFGGKQ